MLRSLFSAFFFHFLVHTAQPQSLTGAYLQTYSNMYVQYTTEIDWKCIKVFVSEDKDARFIDIYKEARLHGGPVKVTTPIQRAVLGNANFTVEMPLSSRFPRQSYGTHWFTNDTLVITGEEVPALYVWQRHNSTEEPADIPRLVEFLDKIPFDVPDKTYREIVSTYNSSSCT